MSVSESENSKNLPVDKTALTIVSDNASSNSIPDENLPNEVGVTELTIVQADLPEESNRVSAVEVDRTQLPPDEATMALPKTNITTLQSESAPDTSEVSRSDDELQPGDHLDRYVIVKKLGQGGMGSVYLIRHETLGVFRAAKVLSRELYARGGEFIKRFVQEARLACSISNPNIVNVLDVCDDPERSFCYIIMEYVDGGTVRDVLHAVQRFSEIHAVMITEAVAEALQAASEQKIVHRDIKPDNIMLTRRGAVKLADLGIAKNTEENVKLTRTHVMMGTPAYLAPEQAKDAHNVDVRADIYSLGATFYEMLTGKIPYPGKNTYDILSKLASEPVPDPRSVVDSITPQTAHLVMKMLAKNPNQRHRNATELLKEIRLLNVISPECDKEKSIRELLEQSGQGNYSAVSSVPTLGNPLSTWLIRHVWLRMENILRRVPVLDSLYGKVREHKLIFYATIPLLTILIVGILQIWFIRADRGSADQVEPYQISEQGILPETESSMGLPDSFGVGNSGSARVEPELPGTSPKPVWASKEAAQPIPGGAISPGATENPTLVKAESQASKASPPEKSEKSTLGTEINQLDKRNIGSPPSSTYLSNKPDKAALARIPVFLEITPLGAEFILQNNAGKTIVNQKISSVGQIKISVPEGQYNVLVSAPGFHTVKRPFNVARNRTISLVKIDLPQQLCQCVIYLYGNAKLLEFLKNNAPEMRIDNGEWKRVVQFPCQLELASATHVIQLRGNGITPMSRVLHAEPGKEKNVVEFFLRQREAVLEMVPKVPGEISINLQGVWEPLKKKVNVAPFYAFTLKWRDSKGHEEEIEIPELMPESVYQVELFPHKVVEVGGVAEFAEAEQLLKEGENKDAIKKLKIANEKGHPEAMYLLGLMNEQGKGRWFSSDSDALSCYQKAASEPFNNHKAQFKLGVFYEEGRGGLDRDIVKALEWYKKSASQKNPEALFRVGMALKNGDGNEPIDYEKMVRYFSDSAKLGLVEAQYQLGYCYENGIGVPLNIIQARYWYGKAAKQNHRDAERRFQALEGMK